MNFAVGSLVQARGREWVVLPPDAVDPECLVLRPLGGSDEETIGILQSLEEVRPASFDLPDPTLLGDAHTCGLLREAVRLGFRATGGPFRSFGHIAVEPRPYQLVPLLMAMKQNPVRLLIADDVGIGKTVEAALVARELMDRGEVRRLAVLCPPQLAEQWQSELEDKFHIRAETVLPSTVSKLERGLSIGKSLFSVYPFTIVSLDYIKSDRHRSEFLRTCPELVIVDEAHACASASGNKATMQRFALVRDLAAKQDRHMLFVTATPHSGKADVFRSLLGFLNPSFSQFPEDLSGPEHEAYRRAVAAHFVQRRRGDIRAYMEINTPFPAREKREITWKMTAENKAFLGRIIALARDNIERTKDGSKFRQRISWWSALALLRAVASSPEAAAATLRNRAVGVEFRDNPEQVDEHGRQSVFDLTDLDSVCDLDTSPGADDTELEDDTSAVTRYRDRLRRLAADAYKLRGKEDSKLQGLISLVKKLLAEGYAPIVFCRFIFTADYVAEHLRADLPKDVEVASVTGILPPDDREARIQELGRHPKRLLVCTDCLSEGINLQERFNAVVHYDLSWNPTRHEQREGRVDRFGQPSPKVCVVTYYGLDNQIDGIVLKTLLHKHEKIRKDLGISVPIPEDSDTVMQAILEGLLLHGRRQLGAPEQLIMPGMEQYIEPEGERLAREWAKVAEREEKRSRTMFAQQAIKVDEVARELEAANAAAGNAETVENFTVKALELLGAAHMKKQSFTERVRYEFSFSETDRRVKNRLDLPDSLTAVFSLPADQGQTYLSRTHPFVERLAADVLNTALDPLEKAVARRAGVMRTKAVATRTTLLLCRFRFQLQTKGRLEHTCLTEESYLCAFTGAPEKAVWIDTAIARKLLAAQPGGNILPDQAADFVRRVTSQAEVLLPHIREVMQSRAEALKDAHQRVRTAAKASNLRYAVSPQGEPDILGVYVFLPVNT